MRSLHDMLEVKPSLAHRILLLPTWDRQGGDGAEVRCKSVPPPPPKHDECGPLDPL
jgi:hypothetical protein